MRFPKKVDAASYLSHDWPIGTRPVQPYRIGYTITSSDSISPIPTEYLLDPIHPWLLRLVPNEPLNFFNFINAVGIHEFLDWAYESSLVAWGEITELFDATGEPPLFSTLSVAWTHNETTRAVAQCQTDLRNAYDAAVGAADRDDALGAVLNMGWAKKQFRIEIDRDPRTGTFFERPADLWARGWFELLDGLNHGLPPKPCMYCRTPFVPSRSSQRFCSGHGCYERAYEQDRSRTRRQYHRDYQRKRRKKLKDIEEQRGGDARGINQEGHNQEG
jgi:hypothetical protein